MSPQHGPTIVTEGVVSRLSEIDYQRDVEMAEAYETMGATVGPHQAEAEWAHHVDHHAARWDCPFCVVTRTAVLRRRVAEGAAWLDRHVPGWLDVIDVTRIHHDAVREWPTTIAGMLTASRDGSTRPHTWAEVAESLGIEVEAGDEDRIFWLGLAVSSEETVDRMADYARVDDAWRTEIEARRDCD